jgi:hypothetical protein
MLFAAIIVAIIVLACAWALAAHLIGCMLEDVTEAYLDAPPAAEPPCTDPEGHHWHIARLSGDFRAVCGRPGCKVKRYT